MPPTVRQLADEGGQQRRATDAAHDSEVTLLQQRDAAEANEHAVEHAGEHEEPNPAQVEA